MTIILKWFNKSKIVCDKTQFGFAFSKASWLIMSSSQAVVEIKNWQMKTFEKFTFSGDYYVEIEEHFEQLLD